MLRHTCKQDNTTLRLFSLNVGETAVPEAEDRTLLQAEIGVCFVYQPNVCGVADMLGCAVDILHVGIGGADRALCKKRNGSRNIRATVQSQPKHLAQKRSIRRPNILADSSVRVACARIKRDVLATKTCIGLRDLQLSIGRELETLSTVCERWHGLLQIQGLTELVEKSGDLWRLLLGCEKVIDMTVKNNINITILVMVVEKALLQRRLAETKLLENRFAVTVPCTSGITSSVYTAVGEPDLARFASRGRKLARHPEQENAVDLAGLKVCSFGIVCSQLPSSLNARQNRQSKTLP